LSCAALPVTAGFVAFLTVTCRQVRWPHITTHRTTHRMARRVPEGRLRWWERRGGGGRWGGAGGGGHGQRAPRVPRRGGVVRGWWEGGMGCRGGRPASHAGRGLPDRPAASADVRSCGGRAAPTCA